MKKLSSLPDSPLDALLDIQNAHDTDETIVATVWRVEDALGEHKWYGKLPYVFSRNKKDDTPDNDHYLNGGMTTRLLDKPSVTSELIERTTLHVQEKLRDVLSEYAWIKRWRAFLSHSVNAQKHNQKATLLSYLMRAFCPDDTAAIFLERDIKFTDEDAVDIIRGLPLDPEKLSDEVLEKIGLTPESYETYTLQARLRYKLWIREKFFEMMSQADIFSAELDHNEKKSTARILAFDDARGHRRIGSFVNTSDLHIHVTGENKERKHRKKIMHTSFRVFDDFHAFVRSQKYAMRGLLTKGTDIGVLHDLFMNHSELDPEDKKELMTDSLAYFGKKWGFHNRRLSEFIAQIPEVPQMVWNVVKALYDLDRDLTGKYFEIKKVTRLLIQMYREKHKNRDK